MQLTTANASADRDSHDCDVLVVGGGPAGSTIAALLAERRADVVLPEKDLHPRFHIGESLLPFNMTLSKALGVTDEVESIGMPKSGDDVGSVGFLNELEFADGKLYANVADRFHLRSSVRTTARSPDGST